MAHLKLSIPLFPVKYNERVSGFSLFIRIFYRYSFNLAFHSQSSQGQNSLSTNYTAITGDTAHIDAVLNSTFNICLVMCD